MKKKARRESSRIVFPLSGGPMGLDLKPVDLTGLASGPPLTFTGTFVNPDDVSLGLIGRAVEIRGTVKAFNARTGRMTLEVPGTRARRKK